MEHRISMLEEMSDNPGALLTQVATCKQWRILLPLGNFDDTLIER
jgi:hypothetical protein